MKFKYILFIYAAAYFNLNIIAMEQQISTIESASGINYQNGFDIVESVTEKLNDPDLSNKLRRYIYYLKTLNIPEDQKKLAESFKRKPRFGFNDLSGEAPRKILNFVKNINNGILKNYNKNLLLIGPTGTGKTTIAEAIAKETNRDYYDVSATSLYTADMIKSIVNYAISLNKPAVIFIDYVDCIANNKFSYTNLKLLETVNELYSQLDTDQPLIIWIMASYNPENLPDKLKKRAKTVEMPAPNYNSRLATLKKDLEEESLILPDETILQNIAKKTEGLNYFCLNSLTNEAFFIALKRAEARFKIDNPEKGLPEDDKEYEINLTEEDYLIALYSTQEYILPKSQDRKFLFKHCLKKLDFELSDFVLDKLAKETKGFKYQDIKSAINQAKFLSRVRKLGKLTLDDLYVGIYYDQKIKFADIEMKERILRYFLQDKAKISDAKIRDAAKAAADNFTAKDLRNVVKNAITKAKERNASKICGRDLFMGLYIELKQKAKLFCVMENLNTTKTPNNINADTAIIRNLETCVAMPESDNLKQNENTAAYLNCLEQNIKLYINSVIRKAITNSSERVLDIFPLNKKEDFRQISIQADDINIKNRLDFRTQELPNYRLRAALIKQLLDNISHNLTKDDIRLFIQKTNGLSCHTICGIIESAKSIFFKHEIKHMRLIKQLSKHSSYSNDDKKTLIFGKLEISKAMKKFGRDIW